MLNYCFNGDHFSSNERTKKKKTSERKNREKSLVRINFAWTKSIIQFLIFVYFIPFFFCPFIPISFRLVRLIGAVFFSCIFSSFFFVEFFFHSGRQCSCWKQSFCDWNDKVNKYIDTIRRHRHKIQSVNVNRMAAEKERKDEKREKWRLKLCAHEALNSVFFRL